METPIAPDCAPPRRDTLLLSGDEGIGRAARIIRSGGLVVMPTETVYGLGANALDEEAVRSIFRAKGRPQDNPLIAHVTDARGALSVAAEVPPAAAFLFGRFSPGPLTIILPRKEGLCDAVTAGLPTVGVRIPAHPVARALIAEAALPIVAPSANISGRPSPTSFAMARADMEGRADAILDGGDCEYGLESTVIAVKEGAVTILRPGAVTAELLRAALNSEAAFSGWELSLASGNAERPASPGMKYTHYKPRAEVWLSARIDEEELSARFPGRKLGIIALADPAAGRLPSGGRLCPARTPGTLQVVASDERDYAHILFRAFSLMDAAGAEVIVAQLPQPEGIGAALLNRLTRSSGGKPPL